jgi:prepilin-type N-terminal cleavage/methylation domain-containing protein
MRHRAGLSLLELMIVIVLLSFLVGVSAYIFRAILLSWASSEDRAGIDITLSRAQEEMVRELREAKAIGSLYNDEVRFSQDNTTFYIYYFFHSLDTYPPAFNQPTYELRKALLSGNLTSSFVYNSGNIILTDCLAPPVSDLVIDGNLTTIDLTVQRASEAIRARTQVMARNL